MPEKPQNNSNEKGYADSVLERTRQLLYAKFIRTAVFKDSFGAAFTITRYLAILCLIQTVVILVLALRPFPEQVPIGIYEDGRAVPLVALNEDIMNDTQLKAFARDCVIKLNEYTFSNWLNHLNEWLPRCMSPAAQLEFQKDFEANIINSLVSNRRSYEAVLDGVPLITNRGVVEGRKAYLVQVPLLITRYEENRTPVNERKTVQVSIIRIDQRISYEGVQIVQYQEKNR